MIPCLNDAKFLTDALAALSVQSVQAQRIVVVDNGSTDDSVQVGRRAGAEVILQRRRGIWPASATGFDAVGTDLIFRVDADSVPRHDWIEHGLRRFDSDPDLHFLVGPGDFYGNREWANWVGTNLYVGAMDPILTPYFGHACPFGSNLGFTSQAWKEIRSRVTRHSRHVHDDLDMAYHVKPWMKAQYDPDWRMPVSARPFDTPGTIGRRLALVATTVSANWPDSRPLVHRRRREAWRRALNLS